MFGRRLMISVIGAGGEGFLIHSEREALNHQQYVREQFASQCYTQGLEPNLTCYRYTGDKWRASPFYHDLWFCSESIIPERWERKMRESKELQLKAMFISFTNSMQQWEPQRYLLNTQQKIILKYNIISRWRSCINISTLEISHTIWIA